MSPDLTENHVVSDVWEHACEIEISMAMYLSPYIVKTEQLAQGDVKGYPYEYLGRSGFVGKVSRNS